MYISGPLIYSTRHRRYTSGYVLFEVVVRLGDGRPYHDTHGYWHLRRGGFQAIGVYILSQAPCTDRTELILTGVMEPLRFIE